MRLSWKWKFTSFLDYKMTHRAPNRWIRASQKTSQCAIPVQFVLHQRRWQSMLQQGRKWWKKNAPISLPQTIALQSPIMKSFGMTLRRCCWWRWWHIWIWCKGEFLQCENWQQQFVSFHQWFPLQSHWTLPICFKFHLSEYLEVLVQGVFHPNELQFVEGWKVYWAKN